ncbi:MAG: hypothetical protein ACM3ZA_10875 [Bacillota bacterium]
MKAVPASEGQAALQLHVKLDGRTLEDMVEEVARAAWQASGQTGPVLPEVHEAVRDALRHYVVAMDICGLASVCQESEEYDPWQA